MPYKILIVDDSYVWRSFLSKHLTNHGYTVEEASDGIDGINKFFDFLPDVVIVDYIMPNLNGIQFSRFIRSFSSCKNVGIILLTASNESINEFWAKKSGANLFLNKSIGQEELLKEIDKFLKGTFSIDWSREVYKIHSQPFGELIDILDESLKYSTILSEITNLLVYLNDEELLFSKLHEFFAELFYFSNLYFLILTPSRLRIYNFSDNEKATIKSITEFLYSKIPFLLPFTKISSNYEGEKQLDENNLLLPLDLKGNLLGFLIFENPKNKEQIIYNFNLLKDALSNLFVILNDYYYLFNNITYDDNTKTLVLPIFRSKIQQSIKFAKRNNINFKVFTVEIKNIPHLLKNKGTKYVINLLKKIAEKLNSTFPDATSRITQTKFACISFEDINLDKLLNFEEININEFYWDNKDILEILDLIYRGGI